MLQCGMGDINGHGGRSGKSARTRVRVTCLTQCMGTLGLLLQYRSGSDVMAMVRLKFRVLVRCG